MALSLALVCLAVFTIMALGLHGAKLAVYIRKATQRARHNIQHQVRSHKARRIAASQASRLGVDAKIDSIDVPGAAEKIPKKVKPLTMKQQLKKVLHVAT